MGIVASAATVVFLAAQEKCMTPNSFFMIHSAWAGAEGNAKQISKTVELLNKVDEQMVNIYTAQMESKGTLINGSIDETKIYIKGLMADETWLTADEAVNIGFADYIMDESQIADYKNYEAVFNKVRAESKFKNFPKIKNSMADKKTLLTQLASLFGYRAEMVEIEIPTESESEDTMQPAPAPAELTPEQKTALIEEYKTKISELETKITELEAKNKEMMAQVEAQDMTMQEKDAAMQEHMKQMEATQANALAKINYKSDSPSAKVNSKFTQDQIIQASSFIKSLLNK
jgi:hypothetical protein